MLSSYVVYASGHNRVITALACKCLSFTAPAPPSAPSAAPPPPSGPSAAPPPLSGPSAAPPPPSGMSH